MFSRSACGNQRDQPGWSESHGSRDSNEKHWNEKPGNSALGRRSKEPRKQVATEWISKTEVV